MKLNHIGVVSSSQENADHFYQNILGLKKIKTSFLDGELTKRIFDIVDQCQIILYKDKELAVEVFVPGSRPGEQLSFGHICLEVKDRDRFLEKCREEGMAIKQIQKGDSVIIFIFDYDGNMFEIKELKA